MNNVIIVGPSLDSRGGISSVEFQIISNWNIHNFSYTHLPSFIEGSKINKLFFFAFSLVSFLGIIVRTNTKIVHIHFSSYGSFYRKSVFLLLSKLFNKKVILHSHSPDFDIFYGKSISFLQKYISYILSKADILIVLSNFWSDYFSDICDPARIEILGNAIYLDPVTDYDQISRKHLIISVGRLGERKGTYFLLDCFSNIVDNFPDWELFLIGDGEIEKVKEYLTKYHKILEHKVHILGWQERTIVNDYLATSSIFALPSLAEGQPISIIEAMAFSNPIISTNVGGIPELIEDGVNGFLVPPNNSVTFQEKLEILVSDESIRRVFGKNSRNLAEQKFGIQRYMETLSKYYQELGNDGI
jgi:glycosyltransferase involved in cell wall biosynthesis